MLELTPPPEQYAERTRRFEQCRPKTSSKCKVDARAIRPNFQAEVRRYVWEQDLEPTAFEIDVCYIELALNHRPEGGVNYLNVASSDAYVATGNCSFIPANQKTMMRLRQGKQLVIGCIFEKEVFAPYTDWSWTPLELAACMNIHNIHLQNALLQISQEVMNPDYQSGELLDALFTYVLIELSRHIRATRNISADNQGKLAPHQLQIIESHLAKATSSFPQTAWLAEQLGMSPRHLARLFKSTTGQTITDYVYAYRINRAKTLLLNSKRRVKSIASVCGFQSPSAFTAAFKRATGLSPKQYRAPQIGS